MTGRGGQLGVVGTSRYRPKNEPGAGKFAQRTIPDTIYRATLGVKLCPPVYNGLMDHISAHINGSVPSKKGGQGIPERATERGELMRFFMLRLNMSRTKDGLQKLTMPRMGRLLEKIPTKDLYYLQKACMQAKDFSKKFWWEINPKNHTPEAKAKAAAAWEEKKLEEKRQKYRDYYNNL